MSIIALGVAVGLLAFAGSRAQPVEGGPDPSTAYGRSVIQNQEYEDQARRQIEQDQQQREQEQDQQRNERIQREQDQYYGSQGGQGGQGGYGTDRGPFGATFLDPANIAGTTRTSYNYPTAASARAAAMGACRQAARHACKDAVEFHNACAAVAWGTNGVWAARAASSPALARDMAQDACQKAGGKSCVAGHNGSCSPRPD